MYQKINDQILFLLVKEPEGVYSFVGGAEEITDQSTLDTAFRELHNLFI